MLKSEFKGQINQWFYMDGKLMADLTGDEKVDRLPITISGHGTELLCVPKLGSGTGKVVADALMGTVSDWDIADKIKASSFDTTSSNTGRINGV